MGFETLKDGEKNYKVLKRLVMLARTVGLIADAGILASS